MDQGKRTPSGRRRKAKSLISDGRHWWKIRVFANDVQCGSEAPFFNLCVCALPRDNACFEEAIAHALKWCRANRPLAPGN